MRSGLEFERSKIRFFLRIEKWNPPIIRQISRVFLCFFLNFGFAFRDTYEIKIYRLSFARLPGHSGISAKDYPC